MTTNASAPDAVRAIEEDSAAVESVVRPALGSAGGTLSGPLLL